MCLYNIFQRKKPFIKKCVCGIFKSDTLSYMLLAVFVLVASYITCVVTGFRAVGENLIYTLCTICLMFFSLLSTYILFYKFHKIMFVTLYCISALFFFLIMPFALMYRLPLRVAVTNIEYSNIDEKIGFLSQMPIYVYFLTFIYLVLILSVLCLFIKKKSQHHYNRFLRKTTIIFIGICLFSSFIYPCKLFFIQKLPTKGTFLYLLERSHNPLLRIPANIIIGYRYDKNLLKLMRAKTDWQIKSFNPQYHTYILIVGESVSADYMSVYGYPHKNCKFLESVNCDIVDNYYSGGNNTLTSLISAFCLHRHGHIIYKDNIISLAKNAGFDTYWLTNQGTDGPNDSPISMIGELSDSFRALKVGELDYISTPDICLLAQFSKVMAKCKVKKTNSLIVLHLIGSHVPVADRLTSPLHYKVYNRNVSEYLQTIEQTDEFIHSIYSMCKNKNCSFSIIYFSDHGQDYVVGQGMTHGMTYTSYHVPFIKIDSDDRSKSHCMALKNGMNFINGFASWLGIKERHLDTSYSFTEPSHLDSINNSVLVFGEYFIKIKDLKKPIIYK